MEGPWKDNMVCFYECPLVRFLPAYTLAIGGPLSLPRLRAPVRMAWVGMMFKGQMGAYLLHGGGNVCYSCLLGRYQMTPLGFLRTRFGKPLLIHRLSQLWRLSFLFLDLAEANFGSRSGNSSPLHVT